MGLFDDCDNCGATNCNANDIVEPNHSVAELIPVNKKKDCAIDAVNETLDQTTTGAEVELQCNDDNNKPTRNALSMYI